MKFKLIVCPKCLDAVVLRYAEVRKCSCGAVSGYLRQAGGVRTPGGDIYDWSPDNEVDAGEDQVIIHDDEN